MSKRKRKIASSNLSKDYWQLPCPTCGYMWNVRDDVKTPFPDDQCPKCDEEWYPKWIESVRKDFKVE